MVQRIATRTCTLDWYARRESNPQSVGFEATGFAVCLRALNWYPRGDLNSHAVKRWFLRPVCLPFHHEGVEPQRGDDPRFALYRSAVLPLNY